VTERTAIPLHGRANAGTVLATTKLGPAARLASPSGLAADDARALRPLKPSASSFVVAVMIDAAGTV
jgi:hypothetical protein